MVDLRFVRRLKHFVPLALLQHIGSSSADITLESGESELSLPDYLTPDDCQAIKGMQLLNRGRLSVQMVEDAAFEAIVRLGERGHGWDAVRIASLKSKRAKSKQGQPTKTSKKRKAEDSDDLTPSRYAGGNRFRQDSGLPTHFHLHSDRGESHDPGTSEKRRGRSSAAKRVQTSDRVITVSICTRHERRYN